MYAAKLTTAVCFFGYSLFAVLPQMIVMIAMEDIVSGTFLTTSVVMVAFSVGDTFSKIFSPFIVRKISFLPSIVLLCCLWSISYTLILIPVSVETRLVGVVFTGLANALAVIIICQMIPLYEAVETNTSAFQTGCNVSTLFASGIYTGLTTWLCHAPRTTMAVCLPLAIFTIIFYALLNHGPLKEYQSEKRQVNKEYEYTTLSTTDHQPIATKTLSLIMMTYCLDFFLQVLPFGAYFFLSYFSYYISANSILTTITISSAPFRPRDHYMYYQIFGNVGVMFGGIMVLVTSLCPDWLIKKLLIRRLWILVLLNITYMMFFLFVSWYHFVSSFYILFVLCATHGYLFGFSNVRIIASCAESFEKPRDQGMAMSIVEMGNSFGRLVVGLMGMFIEEYLRKHCTNRLLLGQFCLARFHSRVGWNENIKCG